MSNARALVSRNVREGWYIGRRNRLVRSIYVKRDRIMFRMEHVRAHGGVRRVEGMTGFINRIQKANALAQQHARENSCNFVELGIHLIHPKDL